MKTISVSEASVVAVAKSAATVLNELLAVYSIALSANNAVYSGVCIVSLWVLARVFRLVSGLALAWLLTVLAFVLPTVYRQNQAVIDAQVAHAAALVKGYMQTALARGKGLVEKTRPVKAE